MIDYDKQVEKKYNVWIWILSFIIPIAVAALFTIKIPGVERMGFLPPIYAAINAITAILLVLAVVMIKKGNHRMHERLMKTAITFSVFFLVLYVLYHMTSDSTTYGGEGAIRYVYFFLLISHILLSIVVIPFVLVTYLRAISGKFKMHKKIARITFPLWLYVAVTGVIVYFMISPYY
jgi:putative membrane protein